MSGQIHDDFNGEYINNFPKAYESNAETLTPGYYINKEGLSNKHAFSV